MKKRGGKARRKKVPRGGKTGGTRGKMREFQRHAEGKETYLLFDMGNKRDKTSGKGKRGGEKT